MGKKWVLCLAPVHYEKNGLQEVAHPGDWIEIGKHQANDLMRKGIVTIPRADRRAVLVDYARSGVVVRSQNMPNFNDTKLTFVNNGLDLPFEYTALWDPNLPASIQTLEAGLSRCRLAVEEGWEVLAIALETTLACDVGSQEEREKTGQICHDLRTPVYEPRLVWMHHTSATEKLIRLWAEESADDHHAFLRSLYQSNAIVRPLPSNWQQLQVSWIPARHA